MGIGIACMLGVVALWSIVPVLVKLLIPFFDPYTIAFLRLSQGAVVVLAVCGTFSSLDGTFSADWASASTTPCLRCL